MTPYPNYMIWWSATIRNARSHLPMSSLSNFVKQRRSVHPLLESATIRRTRCVGDVEAAPTTSRRCSWCRYLAARKRKHNRTGKAKLRKTQSVDRTRHLKIVSGNSQMVSVMEYRPKRGDKPQPPVFASK